MTAYVRNIGLRKPAYAADVEAWINARMKKTGVSRKTVIERTLLFAMKSEERTGKEVI